MLILVSGATACSSYRGSIRAALHRAGVSQKASACAADHLLDRLSGQQVRTLIQAVRDAGTAGGSSMRQLEDTVRSIDDPEIVAAAESAGAGCVLAG